MTTAGDGGYQYEVVENWGRVPPGWSLGVVTGIAVDSRERVYVCQQQQDPPVMVFDRQGNFLYSWGTYGEFPGGCRIVLTGPDNNFHGDANPYDGDPQAAAKINHYNLLFNEIDWLLDPGP